MSQHILDQNNQGAADFVFAVNPTYGVWGDSFAGVGVIGTSENNQGTVGYSWYGQGVSGASEFSVGVIGSSNADVGVRGQGYNDAFGVLGQGYNVGVGALNSGNGNAAYLAGRCCAAYFVGEVAIYGKLSLNSEMTVNGQLHPLSGGFLIDHPANPSERYLAHSFVESSDMKNIYDGEAVLDDQGEALVEMPGWFNLLNGDLRYQLTAVGAAAPDIHIAEEMADNHFKIAGGRPGLRVCWQVTGVREDPWAKANRIVVDEEKPADERGHYVTPGLYAQPPEQSIGFLRHGAAPEVRQTTTGLPRAED